MRYVKIWTILPFLKLKYLHFLLKRCKFERVELIESKNDEEEDGQEDKEKLTKKEDKKPSYIPYYPSYMSTPSTNVDMSIVSPYHYCRQVGKKVRWSNKDEFINNSNHDSLDKVSNKKVRTATQTYPSAHTGPAANESAWKYDHDDVSYCSDN